MGLQRQSVCALTRVAGWTGHRRGQKVGATGPAVAAGGALSAGQTTVLLTAAEAKEAMKKAGSVTGAYKAPK